MMMVGVMCGCWPRETLVLVGVCSLVMVLVAQTVTPAAAATSTTDDNVRQLRRSEISRALSLLKKHSIVGTNAKIVLKNSGKHLLVDPSQSIRVVSTHASALAAPLQPKSSSLKTTVSKSAKNKSLLDKGAAGRSKSTGKKPTTVKRAVRKRTGKESKKVPLNESEPKVTKRRRTTTSSSSSATPSNIAAIQKSLMDNAASKSPVVVDSLVGSRMLTEMTQLVTTVVRNKQASSLAELCDLLADTMDERFGPHWHTVAVASPFSLLTTTTTADDGSSNQVLVNTVADSQNQLNSLTHVAMDDHRKKATFYATFDFGKMLRIFVFK